MFSFIESILALLTALINACFPPSGNKSSDSENPAPKGKRRRYSITKTITETQVIETIGSPTISQPIAGQIK